MKRCRICQSEFPDLSEGDAPHICDPCRIWELERDNERLRRGNLSCADMERFREWVKNPDRKSAELAFTSGAARDAAFILEHCGFATRRKENT